MTLLKNECQMEKMLKRQLIFWVLSYFFKMVQERWAKYAYYLPSEILREFEFAQSTHEQSK